MKIAILRTDGSDVDQRQYNSQEIGLARGLAHQGHTVDIITARGAANNPSIEDIASGSDYKITIIRTGYRRIPVLEYGVLTGLRQLLFRGKYDLVHLSEENNPATTLVAFHCRRLHIPYVIYHGMYVVPSGRARTWYDTAHGYLLAPAIRRNARAVLAKTTTARDFLQARGISNVQVLPVGLDTTRFDTPTEASPHEAILSDLKARYPRVMLYIGSLERRRNPMLMVEMAAAMKADTALILVGAGPMTETVRQRIKALGLNNVLMTGALGQEALPAIYRNSDVFLLPSDYEIYGMVLLEALYFGVPCVTTATAGGIDVIGNNHAGAVIDGVGLDDWVAAVRKTTLAAANPEYSERLQALVRETFSWQKIAQRYMDYVSENRV
ncbi:glycosyltransferase family 4 protein [Marinobacter sp. M3C]|uniref:glycosyltransferase family 4 protein n=1 Tax=Marinobacter sp. M3C TaxID=2917715 RepID=UPI00200C4195|nr:glycosyltransferase family 4 protein [Marinobacter sp. M3C]UQG60426.1 glycosyltransferase family 4 protein [Marinobacter sp. M3C]